MHTVHFGTTDECHTVSVAAWQFCEPMEPVAVQSFYANRATGFLNESGQAISCNSVRDVDNISVQLVLTEPAMTRRRVADSETCCGTVDGRSSA